jgi:hypothetical protein
MRRGAALTLERLLVRRDELGHAGLLLELLPRDGRGFLRSSRIRLRQKRFPCLPCADVSLRGAHAALASGRWFANAVTRAMEGCGGFRTTTLSSTTRLVLRG